MKWSTEELNILKYWYWVHGNRFAILKLYLPWRTRSQIKARVQELKKRNQI